MKIEEIEYAPIDPQKMLLSIKEKDKSENFSNTAATIYIESTVDEDEKPITVILTEVYSDEDSYLMTDEKIKEKNMTLLNSVTDLVLKPFNGGIKDINFESEDINISNSRTVFKASLNRHTSFTEGIGNLQKNNLKTILNPELYDESHLYDDSIEDTKTM